MAHLPTTWILSSEPHKNENGKMDGWWTDGYMDGWMDGWMGGQMDAECMIDGQMNIWVDGMISRQINR